MTFWVSAQLPFFGEFTVWVGGELIEKIGQLGFLDKHKILSAVMQKLQ
jgi:hypothetical protein